MTRNLAPPPAGKPARRDKTQDRRLSQKLHPTPPETPSQHAAKQFMRQRDFRNEFISLCRFWKTGGVNRKIIVNFSDTRHRTTASNFPEIPKNYVLYQGIKRAPSRVIIM
jgi:hypothetical protein